VGPTDLVGAAAAAAQRARERCPVVRVSGGADVRVLTDAVVLPFLADLHLLLARQGVRTVTSKRLRATLRSALVGLEVPASADIADLLLAQVAAALAQPTGRPGGHQP